MKGNEAPSERSSRHQSKAAIAILIVIVVVLSIVAYSFLSQKSNPLFGNRPPVLSAVSADRDVVDGTQAMSFAATAADPDGDPLFYSWNFGDGNTSTAAQPNYGYALPGHYVVSLTVTDGRGGRATNDASLLFIAVFPPRTGAPSAQVKTGPSVTVLAANRTLVRPGESVTFNGNASWAYIWAPAVGSYRVAIAGTNDSHFQNLTYSWGDGTPDTRGRPIRVGQTTHRFTSEGTFSVVLSSDVSGPTGLVTSRAAYTVWVRNAAPGNEVKHRDVLLDAVHAEPSSVDPAYSWAPSDLHVIQNVAETLIAFNASRADSFGPVLVTKVPDLSDSRDVSTGGTIYNFTLKPGVTFQSGNVLNCGSVQFSISRAILLPIGNGWFLDRWMTNYTQDDPSTPNVNERVVAVNNALTCPDGQTGLRVQFHLKVPYAGFLATLASPIASIIDPSPTSYRATALCPTTNLSMDYCRDQLVGTGPFRLTAWNPYQEMILKRNDGYHEDPAAIREVWTLFVYDFRALEVMIEAGDVDSVDLPRTQVSEIRLPSGELLPGIREYSGPSFHIDFIGFNRNIQPADGIGWWEPPDFFADAHVRRAFSYAFDYQAFVRDVMIGGALPLRGPFPQGMFGADSRLPLPRYDLGLAGSELRQSRYGTQNLTIDLFYYGPDLVQKHTLVTFKRGLEEIHTVAGFPGNITVRIWPLAYTEYANAIRGGGLPIYPLTLFPDYADPDDIATQLLRTGGFFSRWVGYSNASLDVLIDRQQVQRDPSVRLGLLSQIERGVLNDAEYIWAGQETLNPVFRSWVKGVSTDPTFNGNDYYSLGKP